MQIIIPMAGSGKRFTDEGYDTIKPLIRIEKKTMIEHVIEMFPKDADFFFICSADHIKNTGLGEVLKKKAPRGEILTIKPHNLGPAYTVLSAGKKIDDDKPVIINYCDFKMDWSYSDFEKQAARTKCDGAMTGYTGFHPHLLWGNKYAGMKVKNKKWLSGIKEKHCFTKNPADSYHSAGTYYFKSGGEMKKYLSELMQKKMSTNGEYYVSTAFELLLLAGKKILVHEVKHFLQWGTPQDLQEYVYWSNYFTQPQKEEKKNGFPGKTTLLVPMAGKGLRFSETGYKTPKPLITISGKPMFAHAVYSYPEANDQVFVCSKKHLKSKIDEKIRRLFPRAKIIVAQKTTGGQASSCLLAENEVDPESSLLVIACDNKTIWSQRKFLGIIKDENVKAVIWTFRNNVAVKRKPKAYAYVKTSKNGEALFVSCKKTISGEPVKDHAVTGTFYFRKARHFFEAAKEMIRKNKRVNNEFYADTVPNELIEKGGMAKVFEVDNYVVFGTPNDLKTYEYWEEYFKKRGKK
ncbi:MAG: NTP transferase domain-containing protein [archaeon]|nr:NTP transferase domain-containing protein [archaeon]